ncbi:MAG: hypothetical protein ACQERB_00985 [Promethearchaeati archaeon]
MSIFRELYDIFKEFFNGMIRKKKLRKLIDNMMIAIETDTVTNYFPYKFKKLEGLALSINLMDRNEKEYLNKYLEIKRYYKTHFKDIKLTY